MFNCDLESQKIVYLLTFSLIEEIKYRSVGISVIRKPQHLVQFIINSCLPKLKVIERSMEMQRVYCTDMAKK